MLLQVHGIAQTGKLVTPGSVKNIGDSKLCFLIHLKK